MATSGTALLKHWFNFSKLVTTFFFVQSYKNTLVLTLVPKFYVVLKKSDSYRVINSIYYGKILYFLCLKVYIWVSESLPKLRKTQPWHFVLDSIYPTVWYSVSLWNLQGETWTTLQGYPAMRNQQHNNDEANRSQQSFSRARISFLLWITGYLQQPYQ